jgi:hypothetical protein
VSTHGLDGDAPIDVRPGRRRCRGVDHHDDLGSTASLAVPFAEIEQRERVQIGVLLERV